MGGKSGLLAIAGLLVGWICLSTLLFGWARSDEPILLGRAQASEAAAPATVQEHGEGHADESEPAAHAEAEHAEGEHEAHHLPSFLDLIIGAIPGKGESTVGHYLTLFAPTIFGILIAAIIALIGHAATRHMTLVPGRLQNVVEVVIGGLNEFLIGVVGPEGRRFVPFCGTLFIYILMMNIAGLVPLMMAPTSRIEMTAALALLVFIYVQFTALRMNGIRGVLYHLAGEPKDLTGWLLVPLMLPLHLIGELAKPFSLAVRLFGNITGEDTLVAVFTIMGAAALAFIHIPVGIPLQVPFVFLALLLSTIQALVFMLLAAIYFVLVMPHGHAEH